MTDYNTKMEMYLMIFRIFGIAAIVMLILSVILFIVLKIPRVFGDLTGLNAKRTIQQMEEFNQQTGRLVSSRKLQQKKKKNKKKHEGSGGTPATAVSPEQEMSPHSNGQAPPVPPSGMSVAPQVSTYENGYEQPSNQETYDSESVETGVLSETTMVSKESVSSDDTSEYEGFVVERSVVLIHTQEVI